MLDQVNPLCAMRGLGIRKAHGLALIVVGSAAKAVVLTMWNR